jgi:DNA-directed RNA polymerase specialized sigma24 family protein
MTGDAIPRRLAAGRATASQLEAFHRQLFLPLVWRSVWKHGLSKEDARDIVQDAFLLAVLKLRRDGNPRAWLIGVVDRLALNHNRKVQRRARLSRRWGFSSEIPEGRPPLENAGS